jgi:hypothetical protein
MSPLTNAGPNERAGVSEVPLTGAADTANRHRRIPLQYAMALAGATIKQVTIGVFGEPYVDLGREDIAMMTRDLAVPSRSYGGGCPGEGEC